MGKINDPNWLSNIKVVNFDIRTIDKELEEQIEAYERKIIELRERLGKRVSIYLPEYHPCIKEKLVRTGRRFEFNEVFEGKNWRETLYISAITFFGDLKFILNEKERNIAKANGVNYYELNCLIERNQSIPRTTGYTRERLLKLPHEIIYA